MDKTEGPKSSQALTAEAMVLHGFLHPLEQLGRETEKTDTSRGLCLLSLDSEYY